MILALLEDNTETMESQGLHNWPAGRSSLAPPHPQYISHTPLPLFCYAFRLYQWTGLASQTAPPSSPTVALCSSLKIAQVLNLYYRLLYHWYNLYLSVFHYIKIIYVFWVLPLFEPYRCVWALSITRKQNKQTQPHDAYSLVGRRACLLRHVRLFATQWTVAHQAPRSVEFSRQECWSMLPFLSPGIEPTSALAGRFFTTEPQGKPSGEDRS